MSGHPAGGHDLGAEWEPAEGIVRGPGGGQQEAGRWEGHGGLSTRMLSGWYLCPGRVWKLEGLFKTSIMVSERSQCEIYVSL